jgi:ABC-type phosphate transport system substrate-binding protein
MKARSNYHLVAGLLAVSCFLLWSRGTPAAGDEVAVVVNKSNATDSLSIIEARKIFMGDRSRWPGGGHIVVLMLRQGQSERGVVLREIYQMNETDYARYFLQAAFAGRIPAPPKTVPSAVLMRQFLAANPQAIGYLRKIDVDNTLKVVLELR